MVKFQIASNRTATEMPSVKCFEVLEDKLKEPKSDFRHDNRFGRFAAVSQLYELDFSEADFIREQEEMTFETAVRAIYNETNVCQLHSDKKNNIDACKSESWRVTTSGNLIINFSLISFCVISLLSFF